MSWQRGNHEAAQRGQNRRSGAFDALTAHADRVECHVKAKAFVILEGFSTPTPPDRLSLQVACVWDRMRQHIAAAARGHSTRLAAIPAGGRERERANAPVQCAALQRLGLNQRPTTQSFWLWSPVLLLVAQPGGGLSLTMMSAPPCPPPLYPGCGSASWKSRVWFPLSRPSLVVRGGRSSRFRRAIKAALAVCVCQPYLCAR